MYLGRDRPGRGGRAANRRRPMRARGRIQSSFGSAAGRSGGGAADRYDGGRRSAKVPREVRDALSRCSGCAMVSVSRREVRRVSSPPTVRHPFASRRAPFPFDAVARPPSHNRLHEPWQHARPLIACGRISLQKTPAKRLATVLGVPDFTCCACTLDFECLVHFIILSARQKLHGTPEIIRCQTACVGLRRRCDPDFLPCRYGPPRLKWSESFALRSFKIPGQTSLMTTSML